MSHIESRTVGLHHAAPTTLLCVGRVQRRFLREMGLTQMQALAEWNLAPLPCRKAIAMPGLLYRIAMRQAHAPFCELFRQKDSARRRRFSTRAFVGRHPLQLCEATAMGGHTGVFGRVMFGLATIWNMVPESAVLSGSVHTFQRSLQNAVRKRASETPDFDTVFAEAMRMTAQTFQEHMNQTTNQTTTLARSALLVHSCFLVDRSRHAFK